MKQVEINDLKLLEILNRIPFFKQFTTSERKAFFASSVKFKRCKQERHVITAGEKETNFYIILAGQAKVTVGDQNQQVAILSPGYFIGEGAFIITRPRTANVIALTDMLLIALDQESLRRFPASIREKLKDQIIEGMAMRLSDMNKKYLEQH